MKKIIIVLLSLLLAVNTIPALANAAALPQAVSFGNISNGKSVTLYNLDFTIAETYGVLSSGDDTHYITDGWHDPTHGCFLDGRGWAVIDLGQNTIINKLETSFWNDWSFEDIVIQVSSRDDFTEAVTVFNNDSDNSLGLGIGTEGTYTDSPGKGRAITFSFVMGRYVRVTNRGAGGGGLSGKSIFTEIMVYGAISGIAPVASNVIGGMYPAMTSVSLYSIYENARIFYTTDGSYPTESDTLYTQPIDLSNAEGSVMIRAFSIIEGGGKSLSSDFNYSIGVFGVNAALGKSVIFMNLEFNEQIDFTGFNGSANNSTLVTDNSYNPSSSVVNTSGQMGWAVIDLGSIININKVNISFWHDWWFSANKVQLSVTAGFDQPITVWDEAGGLQNIPNTGRDIEFETVSARFIRVTNNVKGEGGYSLFTEIQVFTAQAQPLTPEKAIVKIDESLSLSAEPETALESILQLLPSILTVTDSSGNTFTIEGEWGCENYLPVRGEYLFMFETELADNVSDVFQLLQAKVTILGYDKTELSTKIIEAKNIAAIPYTTASYEAFCEEITKAEVTYNDEDASKQEIEDAVSALDQAINSLVLRGDKTELSDYVLGLTLDRLNYTSSSYAEYEQKLDDANQVLNNDDALQAEINAALDNLETAVEALIHIGDKSTLESYVDTLVIIDEQDFSSTSYSVFVQALALAQSTLEKTEALQEEIDAAKEQLMQAVDALVLLGNKSALSVLIEQAQIYDVEDFTEETFAALEQALTEALAVFNGTDKLQNEIDEAYDSLSQAIVSLERTIKTRSCKGDAGLGAVTGLMIVGFAFMFFLNKKRFLREGK